MSAITTHVLDTSRGLPAAGVEVRLERGGSVIAGGRTDQDGRLRTLLDEGVTPATGLYRLVFETGTYFQRQGKESFYPCIAVDFEVREAGDHYHVPLLVSPFGYSTYRGS
jgi:5-hydroxyisourate hydrolase